MNQQNEYPPLVIENMNVDYLKETSESLIVSDEETAKKALSMCLQARKMSQYIDKQRHEAVKPHRDAEKQMTAHARVFQDALLCIEVMLECKITDWVTSQKDNPFTHMQEIKVEDGYFRIKKEWDYEIENEALIPREYLCPDRLCIRKNIQSGVRNIPGIKIKEVETPSLRVKN